MYPSAISADGGSSCVKTRETCQSVFHYQRAYKRLEFGWKGYAQTAAHAEIRGRIDDSRSNPFFFERGLQPERFAPGLKRRECIHSSSLEKGKPCGAYREVLPNTLYYVLRKDV